MRLTMQTYSHVGLQALGDSVSRLELPSSETVTENPLAGLPRADLESLYMGLTGQEAV